MRAQLDGGVEIVLGHGAAPAGRTTEHGVDLEQSGRTDPDGRGHDIHVDDIPASTFRPGLTEAQPAPLTHGEGVGAVVGAQQRTRLRIDDVAGGVTESVVEPAGGIAVRNEADVVAVGLVGNEQPPSSCFAAYLVLHRVAEGEHRSGQLVDVEHAEHIALVLGGIGRSVQLAPRRTVDNPGVVAGRNSVEAECERTIEHGAELDALVAAEARVGRASGGVLGDEVVDDVILESVRQIPYVERDPEHVGHAACIVGVLERAATPRTRTSRAR